MFEFLAKNVNQQKEAGKQFARSAYGEGEIQFCEHLAQNEL